MLATPTRHLTELRHCLRLSNQDSRLTAAVHLGGFAKPKHRRGLRILPRSASRHFFVSAKKKGTFQVRFFSKAETEGFEPSVLLRGRLVSSEVLSTTQPRLQICNAFVSILLIMNCAVRCLDFSWTPRPRLHISEESPLLQAKAPLQFGYSIIYGLSFQNPLQPLSWC